MIGPLGQAMRELEEEEFDRHSIARTAQQVKMPPPVSAWWWLAPPVYYFIWTRRNRLYREAVIAAMEPKDREAFAHVREVANAWIFVAAGASLIAVKDTWELHDQYDWAEWSFWALIAAMLLLCAVRIAFRLRRHRLQNGALSASTARR